MVRILLTSCITIFISGSLIVAAAEPIVIAREVSGEVPKQPQLTCSADGTVHLVCGVGERILLTTSSDGGMSFENCPASVRCPNLSLGMRRGPRIAMAGSATVITAIGGTQGKGRDGDLHAWRWNADLSRWDGPVNVNDVSAATREGLHGMAGAPNGDVWCTWLDLRARKTEIFASRSTNGGTTWEPN